MSFAVTVIFADLVCLQWHVENSPCQPNECQLIDEDIALDHWVIEEIFFDYHLPNFDTNFVSISRV
jgi:hypothetical protein